MAKTARTILEAKNYDLPLRLCAERLGDDVAAEAWADAERRLDGLLGSSRGLTRAERLHTDGQIFPACAIYLAIKERDAQAALDILTTWKREAALDKGAALNRATSSLVASRAFLKGFGVVTKAAFGPSAGFEEHIYEASSTRLRMDVTVCPYVRHCTECGCPEITRLFCDCDEYCYGSLPHISFSRSGTLAKGDARCDFELTLLRSTRDDATVPVAVSAGPLTT